MKTPDEDSPATMKSDPREELEELTRRLRSASIHRLSPEESEAESKLPEGRVGSVPYLNSVPLTRGIEDQIVFAPPSQLAQMLQDDQLDAALVSITEVLFHDAYEVLDGIAVASLGEVKSVFLAHRIPLAAIEEVHCDPASLTSVNLLKVLLAEEGLSPRFVSLDRYESATDRDAVLLIGNPAIEFRRNNTRHQLWDLGQAWYERTQLPFVYAVWALRKGRVSPGTRRLLEEARDLGLETLDAIIHSREEFDVAFRKDYLGWHIHYHLGSDEKRGIGRFLELLRKHRIAPKLFEPAYVS